MGDGLFSKLKVLIGIEEIEEDDDEVEEPARTTPSIERKAVETRNSYAHSRAELKDINEKDNRVIAMQNRITSQFKMVVIEPKTFDECPKLVDNLKSKKPVIINLEKVESDLARKIFDFLSGATYALNGNVQKVANNIFVFAPENVDVAASVDHKSIDFKAESKNPWR
ncbi:cell division protein SepF [Anaerovorax odorimutans]|uniref:cell division protein SepF n=1 Tax=Anaerovorax odorimutans TaxID=109327 RepID=UPI00040C5FB9|nr:cell division protein SepF [Anaerovorax odorimutans]